MTGKIRRRPTPPEYVLRTIPDVPLHFLSDPDAPNSALLEEMFSLEMKSYTAYGFNKFWSEHIEGKTFLGDDHQQATIWAHSITKIIDSNNQPLTGEDGEPAILTATFFLGLIEEDRKAIEEAISKDTNPSRSIESSSAFTSSGSKAEDSEA
jgi:hypothetical protein